jgi:hypothetical protein
MIGKVRGERFSFHSRLEELTTLVKLNLSIGLLINYI